jgi:1-pyrroline-5-carboxylate dehydrogenase
MAHAHLSTVILPLAPRGEFRNQPFTDFSRSENAHAMKLALVNVGDLLGREYDLVIGGERLRTHGKIESHNPARPTQVVGIHQKAGAEHAELAMKAALAAFESWKQTTAEERASLLLRAAALIRERKFAFCPWWPYEAG